MPGAAGILERAGTERGFHRHASLQASGHQSITVSSGPGGQVSANGAALRVTQSASLVSLHLTAELQLAETTGPTMQCSVLSQQPGCTACWNVQVLQPSQPGSGHQRFFYLSREHCSWQYLGKLNTTLQLLASCQYSH